MREKNLDICNLSGQLGINYERFDEWLRQTVVSSKKWRRRLFRSAALRLIAWPLPPPYPLHPPPANPNCSGAAVRLLATLYYQEPHDTLVASAKIARLCTSFYDCTVWTVFQPDPSRREILFLLDHGMSKQGHLQADSSFLIHKVRSHQFF